MKRYFVEEQKDGTYRVFFVNLVTKREVYLRDILVAKKMHRPFVTNRTLMQKNSDCLQIIS